MNIYDIMTKNISTIILSIIIIIALLFLKRVISQFKTRKERRAIYNINPKSSKKSAKHTARRHNGKMPELLLAPYRLCCPVLLGFGMLTVFIISMFVG